MGKGYKHGAGGGKKENPLNFSVVTYPSETELKAATPEENTVGVCTTTTMSSWIFSASEPTEPAVGMVWFSVGDFSSVEFNALKENTLQVYPLSAKQYVSGAWVDVTAFTYQGGEWVSWWDGYLYQIGNQFTSLTGGWGTVMPNSEYGITIGLNDTENGLLINCGDTSSCSGLAYIKNKQDLSKVSKIRLVVNVSTSFQVMFLSVLSAVANGACTSVAQSWFEASGEVTLDVSSLSGECFIGIEVRNDASNKKASAIYVQEVQLL